MSETQVYTGQIMSMRKDRKGVKMDDENWYSAFTPAQLAGVEWKDTVTFTYITKPSADGGRVYRNIKGNAVLASGAAPATATASAGTTPPRRDAVAGVELGHAMNIASQIVTSMFGGPELEHIRTPDDMLKEIMHLSENVYAVTRSCRENPEFGNGVKFNFSEQKEATGTTEENPDYVRAEVPRAPAAAAGFPGDL